MANLFRLDRTANTIAVGATDTVTTYKGSYNIALETFTADGTLDGDNMVVLLDGTSNTVTATLPTAVGITGRVYYIKSINATFTTDIDPNGTETIDGDSANFVLNKDESITIISDNTGWQII
jgi:hypothetical protein